MKARLSLIVGLLFIGSFAYYLKVVFSHSVEYRVHAGDFIRDKWLKSLDSKPTISFESTGSTGQKFVIEIANRPEVWVFLPQGEKLEVRVREVNLKVGDQADLGNTGHLQEAWIGIVPELRKRLSEALKLEKNAADILLPTPQTLTQ